MPTLEFLCIKKNDPVRENTSEDKTYRRGDVVMIKEAPASWGAREDGFPDNHTNFVILTVTGMPEIEDVLLRGFITGLYEEIAGVNHMRVRREKTLRLQDLPAPKLIELNTTGRTQINLAIFNSIVTIRQGA